MSIAGKRSSRGDNYQMLVALDWAITVLSDNQYEWLEVDSLSYVVDDIVIGKKDGSVICCQCKKNQIDFKSWSISDLSSELPKVAEVLEKNPNVTIYFYSRSNFGLLAKLREHSAMQPDEQTYSQNLSQEHAKTNHELEQLLNSKVSSYHLLQQTQFEISPEYNRMEELLHERLQYLVSNSTQAFNALWTAIDQLGGSTLQSANPSTSQRHRLTKKELKNILNQVGVMLTPPIDVAELQNQFQSISAMGRSWRQDIGGINIINPVLTDLIAAIDRKKKSILLTGEPGSGKTCVMLALQETLEERARKSNNLTPLFIQSRDFADLSSTEERESFGLPKNWVELVARMSDNRHVVIIIDSLDVLSIAREHKALNYFLTQIERLLLIPNVTTVTSCRSFDRHYDPKISVQNWDYELLCQPLNWDAQVFPLLNQLSISAHSIDEATRSLIKNPRELALFVELAQKQGGFSVPTGQALAQKYLNTIVQGNPQLSDSAVLAIEQMAKDMLESRSLSIPQQRFSASENIRRMLLSHNILHQTADDKLTFGHQTLLDVLVINHAIRNGVSLHDFIQNLPAVPFVRPSIRSFVTQLATEERKTYRSQIRTVLTSDVAFHIRRLVAECFAKQPPHEGDWPLIRDLRKSNSEIFQVIYHRATAVEWHNFWLTHLAPIIKAEQNINAMTYHVQLIARWQNESPSSVFSFWHDALETQWLDTVNIANMISMHISNITSHTAHLAAPLIIKLLELPQEEHYFLGKTISRCIKAGALEDKYLWQYIVKDAPDSDVLDYDFKDKLQCQSYQFEAENDDFLTQRMQESTGLLNLAIDSVEHWRSLEAQQYGTPKICRWNSFLQHTSHDDLHSQHDIRHASSLRILLSSIEKAIHHHAKTHSTWWIENRQRLGFSHEGALCYFVIGACVESPLSNLELIANLLCNIELLESDLNYELAQLVQIAFIDMNNQQQDSISNTIMCLHHERMSADPAYYLKERTKLIAAIPCHLRSFEGQTLLTDVEEKDGKLISEPRIWTSGGTVRAPFSYDVFLNISNASILNILKHYSEGADFRDFGSLIGGREEVARQLREAASRDPMRFLQFMVDCWSDVVNLFRDNIMSGVADHLNYLYGNLRTNEQWDAVEKPDSMWLAEHMLGELERHPLYWHHNRSASDTIKACSHVITDTAMAHRLVFIAVGFRNKQEEDPISGDGIGLLNIGINMVRGHIVEALLILANNLLDKKIVFPELLKPTLSQFANDEHPAIRALFLQHLPYLQSRDDEFGWELFKVVMYDSAGLWSLAEPCLYYAYYKQFSKIEPILARLKRDANNNNNDLEV